MRIGIDIDDTITNSYKDIVTQIGIHYNVNSYYMIEEGYKYEDVLSDEINFPNYIQFCHDIIQHQVIPHVTIKHGAREMIKRLKEDGNEIILITSRNSEEFDNPLELTKIFLKDNNIYYDALYVNVKEKGKFCKEHEIDVLIDDNITHCTSAKSNNINALLLDNTFNRDNQELERVYSWYDAYDRLQSLKNELMQES